MMDPPHSTLHAPRSTLHAPRSTLHAPRSTLHSSLFTLHSPRSTLHAPRSTLHSPLSTLHAPLFTLHSSLFTLTTTLQATSYNLQSAILLAGGRSQRFGNDKRQLRLWGPGGPTLLEHIARLVAPLCAELVVVLNDPDDWPTLPGRSVPDTYPGSGPLGGLVSGLAAVRTEYALLLACDLPLLQPGLLRWLLALPHTADALVPLRPAQRNSPRNQLAAEPLLAVYRVAMLPVLEACLAQGERRMTAALAQLDTCYLPPAEWQPNDPQGLSFANINRAEDVVWVQTVLAGQ